MTPEASTRPLKDRRRFPRIPLKLCVKYKTIVNGKLSDSFENHTDNLCAGGVGVRSPHPFEPRQMMMVHVLLPPEEQWPAVQEHYCYTEDDGILVVARAHVVWCSPVNENEYRLGLEFVELDHHSRERLKRFLAELKHGPEPPQP